MFTSLNPGALGVRDAGLERSLELAARHGFAGCHFNLAEAHELGAGRVRDLAAAAGVRLSAFGFAVDFRGDDATYERDMTGLTEQAETAAALGVTRTSTWIAPASQELTYPENFAFHARRLGPAAAVLAAHGIRLGLEYVGPATSRQGKAHDFVHTLEQMLELCAAAGDNCGLLLDAWHWYTAREDAAQLRALTAAQVVDVHVNDAPDRPVDEQLDNQRCLPGETGVIDIVAFLGALQEIGYDGPVMVEPFSQKVRDMEPDAACAATRAALDKVLAQAGVA